jgi:hypothetical protein
MYSQPFDNPNRPGPKTASNSYVRILHAVPDAPAVDIYADGKMIVRNLSYKQLTNYIPVAPGNYKIEIFPAGQKTTPVLSTNATVPAQAAFTLAAVGRLANIGLLPIPEVYMPSNINQKSFVRFVHLSPNAPAVDITLPNGTKLFENVPYKTYTNYIAVTPGLYTLLVKIASTEKTVLTISNINLMPGMIYSIYAVGLVGEKPPLEALISIDGNY